MSKRFQRKDAERYDADILLVYDKKASVEEVSKTAVELRMAGNRVFVSSVLCNNIKYKKGSYINMNLNYLENFEKHLKF